MEAKFEIEKAKTRISRNIAILRYIVPVRVENSGSNRYPGGTAELVASVDSQPP